MDTLTITLDRQTAQDLRRAAEAVSLTDAELASTAVSRFVSEHDPDCRAFLQDHLKRAETDIERGRVISHEDVESEFVARRAAAVALD